jgi:hypothetical protein
LEVRPDVPALVFGLAFFLTLLAAIRSSESPRGRRLFALAGLCFGISLLFNQKLLLAGPGLAVFALWYLAHRESHLRSKLRDIITLTIAAFAPLLAVALYFAGRGAFGAFVHETLLNNLSWVRELSATSTLHWLLLRDPLFTGAAAAGFVWALMELVDDPRNLSIVAITMPGLSLLAGLFVTPTPFPQYLLPILSLGAVLGARVLWVGFSLWPQSSGTPHQRAARWIATFVGALIGSIGLWIVRPFFLEPFVYPLFGLAVGLAICVLTMRRLPAWAAAVLIVGCSAYSLQQLRWMQGLSNSEAIAEMRYVYDATTPADRVLDGFSGIAWFRPNAFSYWFLHPGVRARLSAGEVDALLNTVSSCATRPKLIILDSDLTAVSPTIAPTVHRLYRPSPYPTLWLRKDPCAP